MRRILGWLAIGVVVLPLVACQATARVTLSMTSSGHGVVAVAVVLDREAAARIGDVRAALRVADLERAGWVVDPVTIAPDGAVTAGIHRAFASPAEAMGWLRQLGPVQLDVHRSRGLVSTTERVQGGVDLRNGVDAFSDPALAKALGAPSLAAAVEQLRTSGATVPDLRTQLVLHLPGHPVNVSGGGTVSGDTVTWTVPLGQQVAIGAAAKSTDLTAEVFLAVFVLSGLSLVAVVAVRLRARDGSRRPTGGHRDQWSLASSARGR